MFKILLFLLLSLSGFQAHASGAQNPASAILDGVSANSSGSSYALTGSTNAVTFGTTSPTFTIGSPGRWMVWGGATVDYVGATLLGAQTVNLKLRRTNNTPLDLGSASVSTVTQVITALTFTAGEFSIPPVFYDTPNSNDSISMYGHITSLPSLGSVRVTNAWVMGLKIA